MSPSTPPTASMLQPSSSSTLSPAEIANHLREILKPTRQRRRIFPEESTSQSSQQQQRHDSMTVDDHQQQQHQPAEKSVFTLKQMTIICEKFCKVTTFFKFPQFP